MTAATPARPALRGAGRYRTREAGWYRPSRNGAAVLLVHGGGGDRSGPLRHARMLARHGDGVLLYDAPTSTSSTPTSPARRAAHWNLADTAHTHGLRDHPRAYEQRVAGFFDRALADRPAPGGERPDRIASLRERAASETEESRWRRASRPRPRWAPTWWAA